MTDTCMAREIDEEVYLEEYRPMEVKEEAPAA
jgi:hypothetical protein